MKRPPQAERVLDILRDRRWHCGDEFLKDYMPRYSATIWTLRHERGYGIQSEPCNLHPRPHAVFMFRMTSAPADEVVKEQMSWL